MDVSLVIDEAVSLTKIPESDLDELLCGLQKLWHRKDQPVGSLKALVLIGTEVLAQAVWRVIADQKISPFDQASFALLCYNLETRLAHITDSYHYQAANPARRVDCSIVILQS